MKNRLIKWSRSGLFTLHFEDEKKEVLKKLEELEKSIYFLQYEGKLFSSSHIKKSEEIVSFLKMKYANHIKLDENIVFPFIEKHIPRLNPILLYLRSERFEFQKGFKIFEKTLLELKEENKGVLRHGIIERLKDKGIYIISQMRSHIQLEDQSIYKAIACELHKDEKDLLFKGIAHYSNTNK